MALTPDSAKELLKLGHECFVESGAGTSSGYPDDAYRAAGVEVVADAKTLFSVADVVVKVRPPQPQEVDLLAAGKTLISFFYPAQNGPLLEQAVAKGVNTIAMDMVPRISRAQKMDALSSMANIAGYRAVIEAGNNFGRFFTGQVTAAGKVPPAKVLVIGAGVAGLAAIGTATSLGAITLAFDVRPEVAEQIESMGAEFVYLVSVHKRLVFLCLQRVWVPLGGRFEAMRCGSWVLIAAARISGGNARIGNCRRSAGPVLAGDMGCQFDLRRAKRARL